jgi:CRISPR locus-related DNA-binding protein
MSGNLRVHIAPIGFEFLRVTEPLIRMQADKVYLITSGEDDNAAKFFAQIKKELGQRYKHIKVEEVFLDIWDLYDCIQKFRKIILKEKGNHVYINVSTGTKITAIAGMLSCMLWGASPYYAPVRYPSSKEIKLPTEQVLDPEPLPVYDIRQPTNDEMLVLSLLKSAGGKMRKSKLIEKLGDEKIIKIKDETVTKLTDAAKHSQLRAILDPMENKWKFVEVEASGRRSEVSITEKGETALKIFGVDNNSKS